MTNATLSLFTNYQCIADYTYTYDTNGNLSTAVPGYITDFSLDLSDNLFCRCALSITNIYLDFQHNERLQTNYVIDIPPQFYALKFTVYWQ